MHVFVSNVDDIGRPSSQSMSDNTSFKATIAGENKYSLKLCNYHLFISLYAKYWKVQKLLVVRNIELPLSVVRIFLLLFWEHWSRPSVLPLFFHNLLDVIPGCTFIVCRDGQDLEMVLVNKTNTKTRKSCKTKTKTKTFILK